MVRHCTTKMHHSIQGVIPIVRTNHQSRFGHMVWPVAVALALLPCVSAPALADPIDEYGGEYVEYAPEAPTPEQAEADAAAAAQAEKEAKAAAAALKKRIDASISYTGSNRAAFDTAIASLTEAQQLNDDAAAAVKADKAEVKKQQKRIKGLQGELGKLSVKLYKGHRTDKALSTLLDAETPKEIDEAIKSLGSLSDEEAKLVEDMKSARDDLANAQSSLAVNSQLASERKDALKQAQSYAKQVFGTVSKEIAPVINDVSDDAARRDFAAALAENAFADEEQLQNPCPGVEKSDGFGYRDFDGAVHQGLDLAAHDGDPYYAAASGVVVYATNDGGDNGGAGNWIVVAHGYGKLSKYMHSESVLVQPGDFVTKGQLIGYVGQTGAAYGPHLHFQFEVNGTPVDPEKHIDEKIPQQKQ